ncbi:MAG TPA: hypothetical protein PLO33_01275 [Kouleothrix sp.]|uniref:hypothetical protein n=1 Tax=Kouleothrix sp. TaxID=2779161 RepID=UPI002CC419C5|nr:hypothetical protein [Kouleothrix sp.]HRC74275.1 hypothetical protein [Kouleothrix sp.]
MRRDPHTQHLRRQLQQLILLRETGPKSAAWHAARSRMIWRLHDEIKQSEAPGAGAAEAEKPEPEPPQA